MKPSNIAVVVAILLLSGAATLAADIQPSIAPKTIATPLSFTKNMGQWDERVLFRANSGGATMWLTKEGVTYQFTRHIDLSSAVSKPGVGQNRFAFDHSGIGPADRFNNESDSVEQLVLTAKLVGANPNPGVYAEGQMEYKCNYFIGNDPTKWHTDVPNYEAITLKDIYPGIDLKYSGDGNGQASYEFIAAPGADIAQIKVAYEGAESTSLDSDGSLILKTKWGEMIAAIGSDGNIGLASPQLSQFNENNTGLETAKQSPTQGKSGTLTLSYSTYLGGGDNDYAHGIAVDASGNAYMMGYVYSSDFPTTSGVYDPTFIVGSDYFVARFSPSGELIYITYLGGSGYEGSAGWFDGGGIAVDDSGNAYVAGSTTTSDFPTLNPYQSFQGVVDGFVTKLSSSGNSLIYSTYLGGENSDVVFGITVDASGNAYVTGYTRSSNFPTENPYQTWTGQPRSDVFVTKLSSSGNSLIYSTYLGGGGEDNGFAIAVDSGGNAYVTGATMSSDFPTFKPYQGTHNRQFDVFVTKLSNTGNSLIYSTYIGGESQDQGFAVAVDGSGCAYVTGWTNSNNFPTMNPYQTKQYGDDIFVTKLSSTGDSLIYSSYLGGGGNEDGYGIAVDNSGNAYVAGHTGSSDFPTLSPYQSTYQGGDVNYGDAFVTKLSSTGASLIYSTYLGGGNDEEGFAIAIDGSGNAYVTGYTASSNFPTLNPYQSTFQGGNYDAFVTKLTWTPDYLCGDMNGDTSVDISDVVYLLYYIFVGGPAPVIPAAADVNCDGGLDISDVVYMIRYIFSGGDAPCANCK